MDCDDTGILVTRGDSNNLKFKFSIETDLVRMNNTGSKSGRNMRQVPLAYGVCTGSDNCVRHVNNNNHGTNNSKAKDLSRAVNGNNNNKKKNDICVMLRMNVKVSICISRLHKTNKNFR